MQKKEFSLTTPLSKTKTFTGQISITGTYWQDNGELMIDISAVFHSNYVNPANDQWRPIPYTFWTWLDTGDRIGEIAFEHCKGLTQNTRTQTEADLLLNNKLD